MILVKKFRNCDEVYDKGPTMRQIINKVKPMTTKATCEGSQLTDQWQEADFLT